MKWRPIAGMVACAAVLAGASNPAAPQAAGSPTMADRAAVLDRDGVLRWRDDRSEVALFGANYVLPTASDYRAAGAVHGDRKKMIDEDVAHMARMGWNGMRLTFWGDWEASDSAGNLIENDHLDLQDYLIARARERGIYFLFSPIQLYGSNWPDATDDNSAPGFGRHFGKERMGTDPAAIAAQANYLRQILNHVNPYTGVALKDEPAILFIELVNEPWHHPDDPAGSVRYFNTLTDAVRSTGFRKPVFYNVSQDFRIGESVLRSKIQGLTFGWYPTGLNSGHELRGNYLRGTDAFPDMERPEFGRLPRIVYEFDSPDLREGTMYPAMVRTFRTVGAQFAAMFAYDMLQTASRNLGWQTHYLNLVYTPKKAISTVIAAEAMRRLPRLASYGAYPANTRFGDFRVDPASGSSELVAKDAFLYAGTTTTAPPEPASLERIAGYGSSPVVRYGGEGSYFLDRLGTGVWRLEVYPDAVPVRDPFEAPNAAKVVTRALHRIWPMTVTLPDLRGDFQVQAVTVPAASLTAPAGRGGQTGAGEVGSVPRPRAGTRAVGGTFSIAPGVYLLSAAGTLDDSALPERIGPLGLEEYHGPPPDTLPLMIEPLAAPQYLAGRPLEIPARVVDAVEPDSVILFLKPAAGGFYRAYPMLPAAAYRYQATVPADGVRPGPYRFVIAAYRDGKPLTLPSGIAGRPWDWNYWSGAAWPLEVVAAETPLALFAPVPDADRLTFTRIGDAGRRGLFRLGMSPGSGLPTFEFDLPVNQAAWSPEDYTASLVVLDRVGARG
ncbi:MAG: hypothetical protein AB7L66_03370, partial [Gemmatimonadales bacterium]